MEKQYNGFRMEEFDFCGRKGIIVFPKQADKGRNWILKTEYFDAFPNAEISLLEKGYHLTFVSNKTRWCLDEDLEIKQGFVQYVKKQYHLAGKCVIVGMSCGGMIGVKYAARYPEDVSVLYLDAPVMNLLSCPAGIGKGGDDMLKEFYQATHVTLSELINYREHPVDFVPVLAENRIPVLLVCGDSDTVVPYEENGKQLYAYYQKHGGTIKLILKKGCGHHPHGLDDPGEIVAFIMSENERRQKGAAEERLN